MMRGGFKMERAANRGLRLLFRELLIRNDTVMLYGYYVRSHEAPQT